MYRMIPVLALAGCLLPVNAVRAQDEDTDSAIIRIRVPSDAVVSVNGRQYQTSGSSTIEFETRQLQFSRRDGYPYQIKTSVFRGGQWISDRVTVMARAGKMYTVYPELNPPQTYGNYASSGSGYQGGYTQGGGYVGGYQGGYVQGGGTVGGFQGGGFAGSGGMVGQPSGRIQGANALDARGNPVYIGPGQNLNQYNQQHYGGFAPSFGGHPGMTGGHHHPR